MTTENSGDAVCGECGHAENEHDDVWCDECRMIESLDGAMSVPASPMHPFQPAPENSEGSVPASTDRIQEAREAVPLNHHYVCDRVYTMPPAAPHECNCGAYKALTDFEARVRESVEDEQREKYQELVKAATYVLSRRPYVPAEAWAGLGAALSSTEIKEETA